MTAPRVLEQWITDQLGTDHFGEDLKFIVHAARRFHDVATGADERSYMVEHESRQMFSPNKKYFDRLDEALRRIGK